MSNSWMPHTVQQLQDAGVLLVEDGNHGEYRPLAHEFGAAGTPFVRPDDLKGGRVNFPACDRINDTAVERVRKGHGKPGDTLFTHRATVGRMALVRDDDPSFVANPGVTIWRSLRPKTIHPKYLYYRLHARDFLEQVWAVAGSTDTFPYVSLTEQRKMQLSLPDYANQVAIISILGALDDKIDLNRHMSETLEGMARAIFKDWFIDFGPTRAKLEGRAPYLAPTTWALFPDRLDDDGKPDGWENRAFGTMLEDSIGGDWGMEVPDKENDQPVSIVRGTDIPELARGGRGKVPTRYTTVKKVASRALRDLDIVVEVSGGSPTQPTGRSILISQSILDRFSSPLVCASFCRRFRPKSGSAGLLAALHLSNLYAEGGTWEYQNQSTGISNFQTTHFLAAEQVIWPGEELCEVFADQIEPLIRASTRNETLALVAMRDFLLPKLMSGEICVKDSVKIAETAL
jgi:type I restriction enzyme S subunit